MKRTLFLTMLAVIAGGFLLPTAAHAVETQSARGVVFEDRNGNGRRDPGERGLANVRVSNQRDVAVTDRAGRWELPLLEGGETTFFVVKPRGYMPPVDAHQLPRFSYTHKPDGSPKLRYAGLAPSGPLPESIDFPLRRQREPDAFEAIFFGDTQPRDLREVDYFKQDIVAEVAGRTRAKFGVTLGDIVFDNLDVMPAHNAAVALIGLPWWNVIGNHDVNTDAPAADEHDDTYNRIYGPSWFSFDYGPVHFIALNNIHWVPPPERSLAHVTWRPAIPERQLTWLSNDLARVPAKQLVVLMMHVPLNDMKNAPAVYRLIEQRPYVFSISGHTHYHEHRYLRAADGWRGVEPHHHVVNVTACGSWWTGQPDEFGIPHTTMRDGAPNGWSILTFKDRGVTVDFRAARRPAEHQMTITAPDRVPAAQTGGLAVYVNVFNGSEKSRVRLRINHRGDWQTLAQVREVDPMYQAAYDREPAKPEAPWRRLSAPIKSPHLWKGALANPLPPGNHLLCVEATDAFGRTHRATRPITVE